MRTLTLPSGRTATLRHATGQTFVTATRMIQDESERDYAYISILATVAGEELTLDDVLDKLSGPEVLALRGALNDVPELAPGKLSDGRTFTTRSSTGRDILKAERLADHPVERLFHVAAACVLVDGEPIKAADILALPLVDALALIAGAATEDPTRAASASP